MCTVSVTIAYTIGICLATILAYSAGLIVFQIANEERSRSERMRELAEFIHSLETL